MCDYLCVFDFKTPSETPINQPQQELSTIIHKNVTTKKSLAAGSREDGSFVSRHSKLWILFVRQIPPDVLRSSTLSMEMGYSLVQLHIFMATKEANPCLNEKLFLPII